MKLPIFFNLVFILSLLSLAFFSQPHQAFATTVQPETGTLWFYRNYFLQISSPRVQAWDLTQEIPTATFFPIASPANGDAIAFDPTDQNLWITSSKFTYPTGFRGDNLIHKISATTGTQITTIPDPTGVGIRALDYDSDENVLWALQIPVTPSSQTTLDKIDPTNGTILKTCTVPNTTGIPNDSIAVATPTDLNGQKVILTGVGQTLANTLYAVDPNTCAVIATYSLPIVEGVSGIDFDNATKNLILTTPDVVYNMGQAPYDNPHSILYSMGGNTEMSLGVEVSIPPVKKVKYVAFGDSLTTGYSIPTCDPFNLNTSPWGCSGNRPATPYPDKVAQALGYTYSDDASDYSNSAPDLPNFDLARVGIWGYTASQAFADNTAGHDSSGSWDTQLDAITKATDLVTGELGIDDLHFSDIGFWSKAILVDEVKGTHEVASKAQAILASPDVSQALTAVFEKLKAARQSGAKVVVALVYNPMSKSCTTLHNGAAEIVDTLDDELQLRADNGGLLTADLRPAFENHGEGDSDRYTFGTQCTISNAIADYVPTWFHHGSDTAKKNVAKKFDPHPNDEGTTAMANAILQALGQ